MLAIAKEYKRTKDSGVEHLGALPAHWSVAPARAAFLPKLEKNVGMAEKAVLSLSYGKIVVKPPEKLRGLVPESFETYQIVDPGDIIVRTTDLQNDQTSLRVGKSPQRGIITSAYMCLGTTDLLSREFGYQILNAFDLTKTLYRYGSGLRQNLEFADIKGMAVPVPPVDEQAAIVRFLEHADRRIQRYIRIKQKLIKLLEEQKRAIIHRAVSRGLDLNVRLKPSGVEWLGDVPEYWEVERLGRRVELATGFPFKSEGFAKDAAGIRLLRGVNVAPGKIQWIDVVRWPALEREKHGAFELRLGDLVLGMDRPIIQRGTRVATVSEADLPALLLQRVARIRPGSELNSEFLSLLLAGKEFTDYLSPIFTGISVPHLSPSQIKSFRFARPSIEEQRLIVDWVERNSRETIAAVRAAERHIALLREYRARLIADVVTGKLDVRGTAARLRVEVDEPELLFEAEGESDEGQDSGDASLAEESD